MTTTTSAKNALIHAYVIDGTCAKGFSIRPIKGVLRADGHIVTAGRWAGHEKTLKLGQECWTTPQAARDELAARKQEEITRALASLKRWEALDPTSVKVEEGEHA